MAEIVDKLMEMGFDKNKSVEAVARTGGTDVMEAMEWLFAHQDDPSLFTAREDEPVVAPSCSSVPDEDLPAGRSLEEIELFSAEELGLADLSPEEGDDELADVDVESIAPKSGTSKTSLPKSSAAKPKILPATATGPSEDAQSYLCLDCDKRFSNQLEVEFHAAKSGHSKFSESPDEVKPLTEQEKLVRREKLEKMMQEKRVAREENEKQEQFMREKSRIKSGKELMEVKRRQEELEMKKIIVQRQQEKQDEKVARQRVKDQIEADKLARKIKYNPTSSYLPKPSPTFVPPASTCIGPKVYNECKLQIRLTDGAIISHTFSAKEPLSAVRLYVQMNRTDGSESFDMMTAYPKKTFTPEDYETPLEQLGLAPTAVIVVKKAQQFPQ